MFFSRGLEQMRVEGDALDFLMAITCWVCPTKLTQLQFSPSPSEKHVDSSGFFVPILIRLEAISLSHWKLLSYSEGAGRGL